MPAQMEWHARHHHIGFEQKCSLYQESVLIVQQVLPQLAGHELRQNHGDVCGPILALDLLDVVEQRFQQRAIGGLEHGERNPLPPTVPLSTQNVGTGRIQLHVHGADIAGEGASVPERLHDGALDTTDGHQNDVTTHRLRRPIPEGQLKRHLVIVTHERLSRVTGLAVLSSDALSSVAYATEEILRVLLVGGVAALSLVTPIGLVITVSL